MQERQKNKKLSSTATSTNEQAENLSAQSPSHLQEISVNQTSENSFVENKIENYCEPEWLTSKEAANYLRISEAYLRNLASNGAIPFYKFGRNNRYNRAELKKLLLESKRGGFYGL